MTKFGRRKTGAWNAGNAGILLNSHAAKLWIAIVRRIGGERRRDVKEERQRRRDVKEEQQHFSEQSGQSGRAFNTSRPVLLALFLSRPMSRPPCRAFSRDVALRAPSASRSLYGLRCIVSHYQIDSAPLSAATLTVSTPHPLALSHTHVMLGRRKAEEKERRRRRRRRL